MRDWNRWPFTCACVLAPGLSGTRARLAAGPKSTGYTLPASYPRRLAVSAACSGAPEDGE